MNRRGSTDKKSQAGRPSVMIVPTPVYLDYQTVFDMLAVIEDGLSQFQEIKTVYSDSRNEANVGSARADLQSKIPLGFLSMDGEGGFNRSKEKTQSNSKEVSSKKVHTSVSLFAKLRSMLMERNMVRQTLDNTLQAGNFVEFKSRFQRIEVVKLVNTLVQAVNLGNKFSDDKDKTELTKEMSEVYKLIKPIGDRFLSCDDINFARCLIELDEDIAKQFDAERLLYGEYNVFGKVIRVEDNKFNIFESTALGLIKPDYLNDALSELFNSVVQKGSDVSKMFNVPDKIPIIIEGRVFIVKPIAIFI